MSTRRTDRMREVLSLLRARGEVDSQALRDELRVSAATLRRDLSELEDQGLLVRTHGGQGLWTRAAVRFRSGCVITG